MSVRLLRYGVFAVTLLGPAGCGSKAPHTAKAPPVGVAGTGGQTSGDAGGGAGQPVAPANGVAVTPADARVSFNGNVQFKALVTGAPDQAVTWSIQEGTNGGTISATGLYKAPGSSGIFHVIATSDSDAKLNGMAKVTVSAPSGTPPVLQPGVWAEITPASAGLVCCPGSGGNSYGDQFIEIDPGDPNTLYTGIDVLGVWKSTDRGSTWTLLSGPAKPNPGGDSPIRLKVDPKDSNHLYETQGVRGSNLGFWVSKDGGASWTTPAAFGQLADATTTRDVTMMAVDPSDFNHVLVASHSPWHGMSNAGIMESKDGGNSWVAHAPAAWNPGTVGVAFLYQPAAGVGDSKTWLVGTDGAGFWRTTDSGTTWTQVSMNGIPHGGNEVYYSSAGLLYVGSTPYPMRSADNGVTWVQLNMGVSFAYYYAVFGDGTTLYTSPAFTGTNGGGPQPFITSPESDGLNWTTYMNGNQKFVDGPYEMAFDAANRIVYSASWGAGLLAMKLPTAVAN